ncbi:kelch domain-containing protein 8A isoform X3 [Austrofundulus limnaeus]|uniref:Kelch domain-containing protein 8A isoform X3 n=1 Tax=Austrofundulus limnaeus TaxID=52670 RepID=A0A2I4CXC0_AUSLI|nr:PREDICTED: kelch domain-containing protein 8A-like isoform X3 [Austrofundulus limnaeus]
MAVPNANMFHWQSLARLSSGRVYHSLSEVGGQMYMLGGCDAAGRPCPGLELYSPESDQWISLPPMPTPRAGAAVVVLGKQILVVGGVGEDQSPLKLVEMYNTEEGRWRKRSALREALMGVSITVKDGRALAVGGMGADLLPRNILQQYDIRKDMWALLPPMPTPRYDANTHLLGNKLYVAGGRQCKRPVKAFEVYDTESRSWTSLPSLPCKRTYGGVIWDPSARLCLLGGLRQGGGHQNSKFTKNINIFDTNQGHEPSALDTVEAFHPQKKKWERLAPMNFPRCSASSIVIRDRFLVVGGVNQVPSSAHEILYVKEEEYL